MDRRLSTGTFRRNRDGSWTCVAPVSFEGPIGRIRLSPGSSFTRGALFKGVDIAAFLSVQAAAGNPALHESTEARASRT